MTLPATPPVLDYLPVMAFAFLLLAPLAIAGLALVNVAEEQMQRVERQVGILEKAAEGLRS